MTAIYHKSVIKRSQAVGIRSQIERITIGIVSLDELEQQVRRRRSLQRLFSAFPGGLPGAGLLLLRATVGMAGLVQGALFFVDRAGMGSENWIAGVALAVSGTFLIVGLLTPIAGVIMALTILVAGAWPLQPARTNLMGEPLSILLVAVIAVAVALLGPGAFSLDRRMFGRREIIIPRTPPCSR